MLIPKDLQTESNRASLERSARRLPRHCRSRLRPRAFGGRLPKIVASASALGPSLAAQDLAGHKKEPFSQDISSASKTKISLAPPPISLRAPAAAATPNATLSFPRDGAEPGGCCSHFLLSSLYLGGHAPVRLRPCYLLIASKKASSGQTLADDCECPSRARISQQYASRAPLRKSSDYIRSSAR